MKNCKLTSIAFLFILFGFNLNAQISFGVKAEIGILNTTSDETYAISNDGYITYKLSYNNSSTVKSVGIYSQMESGYLFFRPEVVYSTSKHYYSIMNFISDDPIDLEMVERNETVDLSIMGGLIFYNFRIGVGPSFHFLANKENPLENIKEIEFKSRKLTTGFNFGIGYDLGRLSLDFKYENSFSTVGDHIFIENQNSKFNSSPNRINFAIGMKF